MSTHLLLLFTRKKDDEKPQQMQLTPGISTGDTD